MSIKLIAALGNHKPYYNNTRHNAGFTWINQLASTNACPWQPNKNKEGFISKLQYAEKSIILFRPGELMNINGQPIAKCLHYYKVPPKEMLLCYDDLDLAVGTIKFKKSTGHGGHNGVKNLSQYLDISAIHRLKIGIGRPVEKSQISRYVLEQPSKIEQLQLHKCMTYSIQHINLLFTGQYMLFQTKLAQHNNEKENHHGV